MWPTVWILKTGSRDSKSSIAPALRTWKLQLPVNANIVSDGSRDKGTMEALWLMEQVSESGGLGLQPSSATRQPCALDKSRELSELLYPHL